MGEGRGLRLSARAQTRRCQFLPVGPFSLHEPQHSHLQNGSACIYDGFLRRSWSKSCSCLSFHFWLHVTVTGDPGAEAAPSPTFLANF